MSTTEPDKTIVLCCKWCGAVIPTESRQRKYCSNRCRYRSKNAKAKIARHSEHQSVYICRYCGKKFKSDVAGREFCGTECLRNYMRDFHAQNRNQHDMRRIMITKEIPIFPELRPVVGAVYDVERYEKKVGAFYIIPDIKGKRIVVRVGECVEVQ